MRERERKRVGGANGGVRPRGADGGVREFFFLLNISEEQN